MDDHTLLREFAAGRSEAAFATLVERYVNLVWSAARRQVRDHALAEEIASAVFQVLAHKAGSLPAGTILSGWLLRTTRFVAANALRHETRRRQREEAAMNTLLHRSESDAAWERIAPLLDEALVQLGDRDRDVLALRYFDQRSFREIGQTLGVTDDTAQKRVTRALDKLRACFEQHGAKVPAATLAAALAGNCVQAAPAGLAATLTTLAASALTGATLSVLAQTAIAAIARLRFKTLLWRGAAALLVATAVIWLASPTANSKPEVSLSPVAASAKQQVSALSGNSNVANVAAAASLAPPATNQFLFRVLDAQSGVPVPDAPLTLVRWSSASKRTEARFTTSRAGVATLPRPNDEATNWHYSIKVEPDGYVPKYVSWSWAQGDLLKDVPLEHTTKLDRGTLIGGIVTGELNEAIAGVKVIFSVSGMAPGAGKERERLTMLGNYHTEETDIHGRWRCNHVPAQFGMIHWKLVHPDYQGATYRTDGPDSTTLLVPVIPQADFLTQKAAMVMRAGISLTGTVINESGKPIAGAKVTRDHDFWGMEQGANQLTDMQGRFRFRNLAQTKVTLTVAAKGFAPTNHVVEVRSGLAELQFTLLPGRLLRGRVVDNEGRPVAKAEVQLEVDERNLEVFEWSAKTDANGRFEWKSAPHSKEKFVVIASGHEIKHGLDLVADGTEQTVVLAKAKPRSVRVSGVVTDTATEQSIETFQVLIEESANGGISRYAVTGRAGRYNFQTRGAGQRFITEVRADGYMPARMTNEVNGEPERLLNFTLTTGSPIEGILQLPDGQPVPGATVGLLTGRERLFMSKPGQIQFGMTSVENAVTDSAGKFVFQPRLQTRTVVVAHKLGYAESPVAALASTRTLMLRPWGRIEGRLASHDRTVSNVVIRLGSIISPVESLSPLSPVWFHFETRTDAQGQFVFETVPPGDRRLSVGPDFVDGKGLLVEPGETTYAVLGGLGRTVTGRVVATGFGTVKWQQGLHSFSTGPAKPADLATPNRPDFASDADYRQAVSRYFERSIAHWASPEGREALRNWRSYQVQFSPDGSFRVAGVQAGSYHLRLAPTASAPMSLDAKGNPVPPVVIGTVEAEVLVPEVIGKSDTAPVDLGVLELKRPAQAKK